MNSSEINASSGSYYSIDCMVGVYREKTKKAMIYMETDRLREQVLLDFFEACGAVSFECDHLNDGWDMLNDVRMRVSRFERYAMNLGKRGFHSMETGATPLARERTTQWDGGVSRFEIYAMNIHSHLVHETRHPA